MKKCAFCAEDIQDAAIYCKHCKRDLSPAPTPTPPSPVENDPILRAYIKNPRGAHVGCPYCSKTITVGEPTCTYCGHPLPHLKAASQAASQSGQSAGITSSRRHGLWLLGGIAALVVVVYLYGLVFPPQQGIFDVSTARGTVATPVPDPKQQAASAHDSADSELKKLQALQLPESKDGVVQYVVTLNHAWTSALECYSAGDSALEKREKAVVAELTRVQAKSLPTLRRVWTKAADNRFWEHDVDASCVDGPCTKILLVGGAFAANANKKRMMQALTPVLTQLRFKQVRFKWYKLEDEYTHFTLDTWEDSHPGPLK